MPACPGPVSPSAASPPARLLAPTRLAVNGSLGFSQRPSEKLSARRRAPPPDRPAPGHRKITGCPLSGWGELRVPRSLSEPEPGRSASLSSAMKVVGGMQKLPTRTDACPGVGQVAVRLGPRTRWRRPPDNRRTARTAVAHVRGLEALELGVRHLVQVDVVAVQPHRMLRLLVWPLRGSGGRCSLPPEGRGCGYPSVIK